jgi:hypothetical protein
MSLLALIALAADNETLFASTASTSHCSVPTKTRNMKLHHHCVVSLVAMNSPIEDELQDLNVGCATWKSSGVLSSRKVDTDGVQRGSSLSSESELLCSTHALKSFVERIKPARLQVLE